MPGKTGTFGPSALAAWHDPSRSAGREGEAVPIDPARVRSGSMPFVYSFGHGTKPSDPAQGGPRRQGSRSRRDDFGARVSGAAGVHDHDRGMSCYLAAGEWPAGLDDEIADSSSGSRRRWVAASAIPAIRSSSACGRAPDVDAGNDGHRPQPRVERRVRRGSREQTGDERFGTTRTGGSSRVRPGRAGCRRGALRRVVPRRSRPRRRVERRHDSCRAAPVSHGLVSAPDCRGDGATVRAGPEGAARRRSAPSSSWTGAAVAYRTASTSRTILVPRSTCRRWCSGTATTTRGLAWVSPATRQRGEGRVR